MGQKINPFSMRMPVNKNWPSRWFFPVKGKAAFARYLAEDEKIREIIRKKISLAGIAGIEIERTSNNLRVFIKAARPGLVIGQGGKGIEELSKAIETGLKKFRVAKEKPIALSVSVEELKRSEVSAAHLAQQVAWDLEKRMPFRRTVKKYVDQAMQNRDVKGVKILCGGRLDGAEIARHESLKKGALPLQTLRANIDYGVATAVTTYGTIGIKVWIYKGEVFAKKTKEEEREANRTTHRR
jgi:small subunit ribosomal protein S3